MSNRPRPDTLASRIAREETLTPGEIISLHDLLARRCGHRTRVAIAHALVLVPYIPSYGIYERVHLEDGEASYCAGQSYPDEIRTVRQCLLGGTR